MWYWLTLLIVAGVLEWLCWYRTGSTLSQHWWRTQRLHPWTKYAALAGLVLLTIHLVWGWP